MICLEAHQEIVKYIDLLNQQLRDSNHKSMSKIQSRWMAFCMTAMLVTNSFCWAIIERASAGEYRARTLGLMLKKAKIQWDKIFYASCQVVIKLYGIKEGVLVIDDTERKRSKSTTKIWGVHKIKDKKSGGFIQGQEVVFLVLVTRTITLPVGFAFYLPNPSWQLWKAKDKELKEQCVKKADRPRKPPYSKKYPSKHALAISLLHKLRFHMGDLLRINAVLADAAYMAPYFLRETSKVFPDAQFISQIRSNQKVKAGSKPELSVDDYFKGVSGRQVELRPRGQEPILATMAAARLHVASLGRKMLVVALKYQGEDEYRYLAARDLTWRATDVAAQYTWRWLIEVFNQDWKVYEGWGRVALQQGEDGARKGVFLSVLLDHSLLTHSEQLRLGRQAQPLWTVGSLSRRIQLDSIISSITSIVEGESPKEKLREFVTNLETLYELRPSTKHLSGKDIPLPESRRSPVRHAKTG
ncbi:MAG: transposase [Pseudobdellovibrionaceae bacterium]|nr:transposase [Pseudobdellovibrionaceae bacterium]